MIVATFFMTSSSESPDRLLNRSIKAFFSASSFLCLRISSLAFSASATSIFCIKSFTVGIRFNASSVVVIVRLRKSRHKRREKFGLVDPDRRLYHHICRGRSGEGVERKDNAPPALFELSTSTPA